MLEVHFLSDILPGDDYDVDDDDDIGDDDDDGDDDGVVHFLSWHIARLKPKCAWEANLFLHSGWQNRQGQSETDSV